MAKEKSEWESDNGHPARLLILQPAKGESGREGEEDTR